MTASPRLTPEEQLRKAHMPSAQQAVCSHVGVELLARFPSIGVGVTWRRNSNAHYVRIDILEPQLVWSMICDAIDRVSRESNILESDTRELLTWARKRRWVSAEGRLRLTIDPRVAKASDLTLEEWNVALGGRVGGMSANYYGDH